MALAQMFHRNHDHDIRQDHGEAGIVADERDSEHKAEANVDCTLSDTSKETPGSSSPPQRREGEPRTVLDSITHSQYTAKSWTWQRHWTILIVMWFVQVSQNYNAAVFPSMYPFIEKTFHRSSEQSNIAQMIFLVLYAIGCELWAPFSEDLGRKWVLSCSLLLVLCWQILLGASPTFAGMLAARALAGLSSAGGSVTMGMVADMYEPETQFQAVAFTCFGSVSGSVLAPIASGIVAMTLGGRWVAYVSAILAGLTLLIHLVAVPETRAEMLLDRKAQALRRQDPEGNQNVSGPWEGTPLRQRLQPRQVWKMLYRPYVLLLTEPIALFNALLSGFSDALIFSGLESFGYIMAKWGFDAAQAGYSFTALMVGYLAGWALWALHYRLEPGRRAKNNACPEQRLALLCWVVPLEALGLIGLAFCSLGPRAGVPWIAPLVCVALVGLANYGIYIATIDYLIAAYGPASAASATGGNGFCRDLFAGLAALYTKKAYTSIHPGAPDQLLWPTLIFGAIGLALAIPVYVFYWKGHWFRVRSKYAMSLERLREGARP